MKQALKSINIDLEGSGTSKTGKPFSTRTVSTIGERFFSGLELKLFTDSALLWLKIGGALDVDGWLNESTLDDLIEFGSDVFEA